MDKENYNDNDLKMYENLQPEEIVDRIMDTHVLDTNMYRRRSRQQNEQNQNESTSVDWSGGGVSEDTMVGRRTRRYAQEDADQQYTMRFQTIQSENDNMYQSGYDNSNMYQTQKIDFTPQYSHQQNYNDSYDQQPEYERQDTNYNAYDSYDHQEEYGPSQNTNYNVYQNSYQGGYPQQNTYEDNQQRKGPFMQEIQITLPGAGNSGNTQEDTTTEGRRKRHSNYDDYDLARGAKQIDLDELYSDDFDDEESITFRPGKKLSIVFSVILIALIGFLGFRCISLGGKLKEAEKTIAENADISEKYETLQMDKLKLEEELNNLKAGGATAPAEGQSEGENQNNTSNTTNTTTTDDPGNFDWYTVTDGDSSWWALAQKFYGDGTQYTKILEANGKKESDYVKTGDKLKIPK